MTPEEFKATLSASETPVVVDFWAPWCGPCRQIDPVLKKLDQSYQGKVKLLKINADENPDLLRSLGIMGIPTLIAFQGGKQAARIVGAQPAQTYARLFESLASGEQQVTIEIATGERLLRVLTGVALLVIAVVSGWWWLTILSGLAFFSAVHDRCPLMKMLRARLADIRK